MSNKIIQLLTLVVLCFVAVPQVSAQDRFYADDFNMEPGTTGTVSFSLENSQEFVGFQADFVLPEGLEIVPVGDALGVLTSRADDTYSLFSNTLADGTVRIGAFSVQNTPFVGSSGGLLDVTFRTTSDFVGGVLHIRNIKFVDLSNNDVVLPDVSVNVGTQYVNSFYIQDFHIDVGETKTVSMMLDNEQAFTAFQADIYMPAGLSVVPNSFTLTSRAGAHSISSKDFGDGRTRIACFSTSSEDFTGNAGALVTFDVTADKNVSETAVVEIRNVRFTTSGTKEVSLPNSSCSVTTERALVELLVLSPSSLTLFEGQSTTLTVEVLPEYASTKDVEWSSSAPDVATVDASGRVVAVKAGSAVITCSAVDGSGVQATCNVTVTEVPVTSIKVVPSELSLKVTESARLVATVEPETASNKNLSWSSSDETIVKVDAEGNVTAVKEGRAVVTVTAVDGSGVKTEVIVTVLSTPVSSIVLNRETAALQVSGTIRLSATVMPETATNKGVTWSSSNDAVATVSADGLVTAMSLGEALITATAADGSGVTATCRVTVGATPAEGVSIAADGETTLKVGGAVQLRATVTPDAATDKSVSWSTGNANVATVDVNGLVTAVGVGTTTITCTNSAGQTATIDITVERTPVSSITLNCETAALQVSGTIRLSATVMPETATNKGVTWSSSNDAVATVSADGLVTAMSLGEALITATAADGSGVTATCRVTVGATPAEGVSIAADGETTLKVGGAVQLRATVTPDAATDKSVSWSTGNANVATVDVNGLVTAVGVGTTTITCTNSAGQTATIDITVEPTLVTSISLDRNTATLNAGESLALSVTVLPDDATDKSVTWTSSNDGVATVDADGVVTAVGTGVAEVTATANDGSGLSASCSVTVELPSGIAAVGCEGVRIVAQSGRIVVTGLSADDEISITTIGGGLVYKGTDKSVNVPSSGIYIIGIKGLYYKVAVR